MYNNGRVKFLINCAKALSPETHTHALLKSYYTTKCHKLSHQQVQLLKSQMCPHCGSIWSESAFELKLQPQRVANNAKARKLIAKLEAESKSKSTTSQTNQEHKLTKKQRCRAKWLRKRVSSNMQITCSFCKKKCSIPLRKPKSKECKSKPVKEVVDIDSTTESIPKKKKTKKKKQSTAGLKIPKELLDLKQKSKKQKQEQEQQEKNTSSTNVSSEDLSGGKSQILATQQKPKLLVIEPSSSSKLNKQKNTIDKKITSNVPKIAPAKLNNKTNNLSQSLKTKNKKKEKNAKQTSKVTKIQSKTQKQNALLQLATLLKTQATKQSTNTTQSRLKAFLK